MEDQSEESELEIDDIAQKTIDQIKQDALLKKQWRKEMKESIALQEYFNGCTPDSVKQFQTYLLMRKARWYQYGEMYKEMNDQAELRWVDSAFRHLSIIQQKKLFDIQCQWRAELIKIPEIEICFDFRMWEGDTLNCPFITPVNEEDIQLYSQYLLTNDNSTEDDEDEYEWQDYDGIKEAYNNEEASRNFPDWYEFYNIQKGTSGLLLLPDIRGQKETDYRADEIREARLKSKEIMDQQKLATDERQVIDTYNGQFLEWYVKTFEDKKTQQYYRAYTKGTEGHPREEQINRVIQILLYAEDEELIPIESHHDWMEALSKAARLYQKKKIVEVLPQALNQYIMNIQTGIPFSKGREEWEGWEGIRDRRAQSILRGRERKGEPRDFNF